MGSGRKPMSKHNARSIRVSICVQPKEAKQINKLAHDAGLTVSTYLRIALRDALELKWT